jgi:hypothetical protein
MSFTTTKPPTLEGLEAAVNAQTEAMHRMLRLQAMQGEILSKILAAVTRQPASDENPLEVALRHLMALGAEHAARLAEVVTLLKDGRR